MYDKFVTEIHNAAKIAIPIKRNLNRTKKNGNIWWTDSCEIAVKNKNKGFKNYLNDREDKDLKIEKRRLNVLCNKVCAEAKLQYWIDFAKNEVKNPSDAPKVWKKTSEMKNGYHLPQCQIKIDDNKFPSQKEKAEEFSKVFSHVSNTNSLPADLLASRIQEESHEQYKDPEPDNNHFLNAVISYSELRDCIFSVRNKKSAVGADGLSYVLLSHFNLTDGLNIFI